MRYQTSYHWSFYKGTNMTPLQTAIMLLWAKKELERARRPDETVFEIGCWYLRIYQIDPDYPDQMPAVIVDDLEVNVWIPGYISDDQIVATAKQMIQEWLNELFAQSSVSSAFSGYSNDIRNAMLMLRWIDTFDKSTGTDDLQTLLLLIWAKATLDKFIRSGKSAYIEDLRYEEGGPDNNSWLLTVNSVVEPPRDEEVWVDCVEVHVSVFLQLAEDARAQGRPFTILEHAEELIRAWILDLLRKVQL